MKKIIIGLGIIAIILVVITLNYDNIYVYYKVNQIAKDTVNCLNGKFSKNINEMTIKRYEKLRKSNEELNHYNITELVDKYIEMAEKSIEVYYYKKSGNKSTYKNNSSGAGKLYDPEKIEGGYDIRMECEELRFDIADNLTEDDIKNYNNGIFKSLLVEKLKETLDYEIKYDAIEWQINSVNDLRIELPYDCYIDYKAYIYKPNEYFKMASKVVDKQDFLIDRLSNSFVVEYKTSAGKRKKTNVSLSKFDNTYVVSLSLLGECISSASAELKSHTRDKRKEEVDREYIEKWGKYIE